MNQDANALMLEYAKNPPNKRVMDAPTFSHHEHNRSCWDSMEVFILLSADGRITDFSFSGDTAIVTTAAAAIFGEQIIGVSIREVLDFTYEDIRAMLGTDVSPKRRMAACLGLLATRNAIHEYLKDGIRDDFSDVLE